MSHDYNNGSEGVPPPDIGAVILIAPTDGVPLAVNGSGMSLSERDCDIKPTTPPRTSERRRWGTPKHMNELDKLRMDGIPKKMQDQMKWSLTVWREWAEQRRGRLIQEAKFEYPLAMNFGAMTPEEMNFWLANFVVEARRDDEKQYPANTLYQLCCGLARSLKSDCPTIELF